MFAADVEHVFTVGWLFVGHSCELRAAGDYYTVDIGRDRVIVVRGRDNEIHAHHDVCAHRGSRIVSAPRGNTHSFVCPYHRWVYGLDGRLRAARQMGPCFSTEQYRLAPVAVREVAGLVFVCLAADPPPFEPFAEALAPQLRPHGLADARIAARERYRVAANWKTVVENSRECYHCGNHPEFLRSNFELGMYGDLRTDAGYDAVLAAARARWRAQGLAPEDVNFPDGAWYRIARVPLREGYLTETLDGHTVAPVMGTLTGTDTGSLRMVALPNLLVAHANCDYAMTTAITPVDVGTTDVEVTFLVHRDAALADTNALTAVWRSTSEQDWLLCERAYAGTASRGYRPGPLSPLVEGPLMRFHEWYVARLRAGVRGETNDPSSKLLL
ncbi:aromatic ring-hydroxylating oxygenase subunit alpha [Actinophytocola algeriensis]|uniref:Rieske 2Fe-2S family protein n=1 Tax=Actinophytocola algeriensis TaxID=1768010 RepID=A0A7W7VDH5_9PSEU|nr:aromatic ring-hydroxylating dioxygenase subunit alpha [Actinophytocola algeriensis]MBB4906208.1 Rieske 2Fe-2S family protein [Actinophytocola algeriensis]MBE1472107.1 Rieske 2Fe-2S family protein [Actinophytocola algeriensis]